jgi:hypothetical protein
MPPDKPDFMASVGEACLWRYSPGGPKRHSPVDRLCVVIAGSFDRRVVLVEDDGELTRRTARANQLHPFDGPEPPWVDAARAMIPAKKRRLHGEPRKRWRKPKHAGCAMTEPVPDRQVPSDPDLSHLSEGRRRAAEFAERLKWGPVEVGGEDDA